MATESAASLLATTTTLSERLAALAPTAAESAATADSRPNPILGNASARERGVCSEVLIASLGASFPREATMRGFPVTLSPESGSNRCMTWVFSAVFAGITAVLAKVGVEHVNSNLATAIRTAVVLLFTWAIVFATEPGPIAMPGRRTLLFLGLSGLATGLSWLCYFRALQLGEASRVAPIDKLSVVFAIVLAGIFLRERLTWQHAVGGTLIVAGSLVLAWKGR